MRAGATLALTLGELNGYGESCSLPVRVRHMKNEADVKDQSAKSRHIPRAAVTLIAPLCGHL